MASRFAEITRRTNETEIALTLLLDGSGRAKIETGVGFMDHMLHLLAAHGTFDLTIVAKGDVEVDDHHTVEDLGIALGEAFKKALEDKRGINRYGTALIPMDEALIQVALDFSGRTTVEYHLTGLKDQVGTFDTELVEEFFLGFSRAAGLTLHVDRIRGKNTHHIIEGAFKAFGRALKEAVEIVGDEIPSTKGLL